MTSTGKQIRLNRLIQAETQSAVIYAFDHGMTSPQLLPGLLHAPEQVRRGIAGGANVLMLSRGIIRQVAGEFRRDTSLALMLTASASGRPGGNVISPVGSVEEALRLGADAVVVFVALGTEQEADMISYLSDVGEACEQLGMPLIAEAEYPTTYQSLDTLASQYGVDYLLRNARMCAELGADIVKTNWTGDTNSYRYLVEATGVPVVVAGGSLVSDKELLERMEAARAAGAVGCSVGRNIFEHRDPEGITRAICMIWREKRPAIEALAWLEDRLATSR
jgi:fructose-bisphosphate aldolase / 2-amino-3,7-dideoxy-D-threo-hept-6-ulosonate synthase